MKEKYCSKCRKLLPLSEFRKQKAVHSYYYRSDCISCQNKVILKYQRLKIGIAVAIYNGQKNGHKHKYYHNRPRAEYTLVEFQEWFFSQPNLNTLYNNWVASGYKKDLKPSCDRIDNNKGYVFNNLQLITWQENNLKGIEERRTKKHIKITRDNYILQFDKEGYFLKSYKSLKDVFSKTYIDSASISKVCNGRKEYAGGYKWERVVIERTTYPYKDFKIYFKKHCFKTTKSMSLKHKK